MGVTVGFSSSPSIVDAISPIRCSSGSATAPDTVYKTDIQPSLPVSLVSSASVSYQQSTVPISSPIHTMQRGLVALGALALALGGVICTPLADTGPAPEALLVGSLEFGPSAADGTLRSSNQAAGQVLESTQLDRSDAVANRHQIVYTLGGRRPGDRLVGLSSDSKFWSTAQDVKLDLQYPQAGVGAVVTYVEVTVDQSSQAGTGYVVAGGIGQRFVRLVIEAYGTQHFTYTAAIYGV